MILLAVDPSINCSGVALFWKGKLTSSGPAKTKGKGPIIIRVVDMADLVCDFTHEHVDELAMEWPQVYTQGGNDRNDLLGLAGVCGAVCSMMAVNLTRVHTYLPKEWAGNVPKSKSGDPRKSPRGLRIAKRLSPAEIKVWAGVKSHDVVDAIGIGLHHLGRLERKRVFAGAS